SGAIEEAKLLSSRTSSAAVVYFYCSFDVSASQEPANILGSFLAQLSAIFPEILEDLKSYYRQLLLPSVEDLIQIILKHSAPIQTLFIFIDALNETNKAEEALEAVLELQKRAGNMRIMVTSSSPPVATVMQENSALIEVTMSASSTREDIQAFVNNQVDERALFRHLDAATKKHIKRFLVEKSDGM
ncbi:hypothetical protein H2201_009022, partial [Coniosporium apollinis]